MRSPWFQFSGFAAALVALFVMVGGHWAVLQSIAWGHMIADFSRTESLGTAIEKTFDGENPCDLCLDVRKGRAEEKQQTPVVQWEKLPKFVGLFSSVFVPRPPPLFFAPTGSVPVRPSGFISTPPTPPPRAV